MSLLPLLPLLCACAVTVEKRPLAERPQKPYDVVVYGGTSAGISAALQVRRMGRSVIIVCPDQHLGGMTANGLGWTDSGDKAVIGGLSRAFYGRLKAHYDEPQAWRQQRPEECSGYRPEADAIWVFEPHVAERAFEELVAEAGIPVHRDRWLDREDGVLLSGAGIETIRMLSGETYAGRIFIDATYEGDLMAAAGVSYSVGREANSVHGETLNGVQTRNARSHQFGRPIDPYVLPGDPASGLLPRIQAGGPGPEGSGDRRLQAYNYRLCMTDAPANRLPFPRPAGYDAGEYELLLRVVQAGSRHVFGKFDPMPNRKTDTNNHGPFSTDNIGRNYDYPEASYERRREILAEHERYQKGYHYFLSNDPRLPDDVRERMRRWGLAADEFTDNGGWPHQIYVREARRMVSDFVMSEPHLRGLLPTPDPVGMGSYNMDSHNVQRYVARSAEGVAMVRNEGDIQVNPGGPYPISYGALVPRRGECTNLLVPICLSSSHIAYGSIRMEPVFMILGQSAATAACLSLDASCAVQDVDRAALRARLLADGQVLEHPHSPAAAPGPRAVPVRTLSGIVVDDEQAELLGGWVPSVSQGLFVGRGYVHDGDQAKGHASARFEARLPAAGRWEVQLAWSAHPNRASNVPVRVEHPGGPTILSVDQRAAPATQGLFHSLGIFSFPEGTTGVTLDNTATDGYVIADAVRWIRSE
ncbi:MAG TPA: FAD-dependent oxidoreductase [Planctomycetota bacterium]|nr:FAD-dependent oxidoreductase [Planctomycetota bacterium]